MPDAGWAGRRRGGGFNNQTTKRRLKIHREQKLFQISINTKGFSVFAREFHLQQRESVFGHLRKSKYKAE